MHQYLVAVAYRKIFVHYATFAAKLRDTWWVNHAQHEIKHQPFKAELLLFGQDAGYMLALWFGAAKPSEPIESDELLSFCALPRNTCV